MYIEQIFNRTGVSTGLPKRGIAAIMLAAGMAVVSPAAAQSQGYGERAEREQRYDPTDWEDDNWEGEEPWDDGDWDDEEWTDRDWSDNDWNTAYEVYGEDDIGDDYWGEDRWYNEDWHHDDWYAADPYYDAWDYYYDFDGYDDDYHYYRDYRDDWGSRDDDEYYWRDDDWGVEYDGWDERDRYEDRDWQYERWSSDRGDLHRQVQIRGELEGWSRVRIQGQPEAHTLVRLRMEDGRSAVVNLGPNVDLSRLRLDRGERVAVRGERGSIDGRSVVMARQVRTGEGVITMDKWDRFEDTQDRTAEQSTLSGEVEEWSRVSLQGQKDQHTLVRLRLEDGRSAIVNLGPNVDVSRLNLDRGDRIQVLGQQGSISDRDVLMAREIRTGEGTVTMDNWDTSEDDQVGMGSY